MSRPARQILALLGLTVAAVATVAALLAPSASAHSELKSSNPAQGQVVPEVPDQVELNFNQQIAPEFAAVALGPRKGGASSPLEVSVQGTTVTATVTDETAKEDQSGRWQLSYRVTSADGHPIEGSIDFVVRPAKTQPTESPTDTATDSSTDSSLPPVTTEAGPPSSTGSGSSSAENPRTSSSDSSWTSTLVLGSIALVVTVAALVFLKRRSDAE